MISYEAKTTTRRRWPQFHAGRCAEPRLFRSACGRTSGVRCGASTPRHLGIGSLRDPYAGLGTHPLQQQSKLASRLVGQHCLPTIYTACYTCQCNHTSLCRDRSHTLTIQIRQGNMGTVGVRYYLPFSMSVDLFDRWYLAPSTWPTKHRSASASVPTWRFAK